MILQGNCIYNTYSKNRRTALNESSRQIINLSHSFNVSKIYRIPKKFKRS